MSFPIQIASLILWRMIHATTKKFFKENEKTGLKYLNGWAKQKKKKIHS